MLQPLQPARLRASLSAVLGLPARAFGVGRVAELSPGLSGSRLFRIEVHDPEQGTRTLILKVPDWGTPTGLDPRDSWVSRREIHFYESGLTARLPPGLRAPGFLGVDRAGPGTWLWLEDAGSAMRVAWGPVEAVTAARRAARLHRLFLDERESLTQQPWLERGGDAAFAHHVPAGHRNLETLPGHHYWSGLLSAEERQALHRALDLSGRAVMAMHALPVSLAHGDFHIRNLGFDSSGDLVALDWAHVGLAPPGCDVATLVSLYTGMGGAGDMRPGGPLEQSVMAAYLDELGTVMQTGGPAARELRAAVRRAAALWHLTWGLHLRLGPGLDWLLRRPDPLSPAATAEAASIRDGCLRAVSALGYLES
ncbi:MAG TPA: phosphotransferase [Chloroflexota bacterium]|nr:phosphotransferase [Chloroflexota bacterium]